MFDFLKKLFGVTISTDNDLSSFERDVNSVHVENTSRILEARANNNYSDNDNDNDSSDDYDDGDDGDNDSDSDD